MIIIRKVVYRNSMPIYNNKALVLKKINIFKKFKN